MSIQLYAGDSKNDGVTRAQGNETIACSDPKIDTGIWLTYDDLKSIYGVIQECKQWPKSLPLESKLKAYKRVKPVIDHFEGMER